EAIQWAKAQGNASAERGKMRAAVVITGSVVTVGEARAILKSMARAGEDRSGKGATQI
ncbi:MAG: hypothetical protein RLZZ14_434, partial [Actinomycetota bacterium]